MPVGEYKIAKQSAGRMYYARVRVDVCDGQPSVVVADDVFAWIKDAYGPGAFAHRDADDFRGGARAGAEFALRNLAAPGPTRNVRVTEIHFSTVDTTRTAVAFAACHAVWAALDDPGAGAPAWDRDRWLEVEDL